MRITPPNTFNTFIDNGKLIISGGSKILGRVSCNKIKFLYNIKEKWKNENSFFIAQ